MGGPVRDHINIKLDPMLMLKLQQYVDNQNISISQAVRLLLATALREQREELKDSFKRQALREGITTGVRLVKKQIESAIHQAFGEMDQESGE